MYSYFRQLYNLTKVSLPGEMRKHGRLRNWLVGVERVVKLPANLMSVRYNGSCYPGAPSTLGLESGANCQRFAYALLQHFGLTVPEFRSSELWQDELYTKRVSNLAPLDLLLWNKTEEAWGAHVGVYLGEHQAVHLSRWVGAPVVWDLREFGRHASYQIFIGAKRVKYTA